MGRDAGINPLPLILTPEPWDRHGRGVVLALWASSGPHQFRLRLFRVGPLGPGEGRQRGEGAPVRDSRMEARVAEPERRARSQGSYGVEAQERLSEVSESIVRRMCPQIKLFRVKLGRVSDPEDHVDSTVAARSWRSCSGTPTCSLQLPSACYSPIRATLQSPYPTCQVPGLWPLSIDLLARTRANGPLIVCKYLTSHLFVLLSLQTPIDCLWCSLPRTQTPRHALGALVGVKTRPAGPEPEAVHGNNVAREYR